MQDDNQMPENNQTPDEKAKGKLALRLETIRLLTLAIEGKDQFQISDKICSRPALDNLEVCAKYKDALRMVVITSE